MESKTYLPLPIASAEYDQSSEQIFRNTAQINFQDVASDINDLGLHNQKDASLSLRKFIFLGGCDTTPSVGMFHTLTIGGTTTVASILDEDDMASDSPTALATQQSIKAYVQSAVTAEDLDFAGDTGTGAVDLDSQVFTVAGTANEIETSASGQTLTVGLPDNVTIATALSVDTINEKTLDAGVTIDSVLLKDDVVNVTDVETSTISANDGVQSAVIANTTGVMTIASSVLTTADINGGTADGVVIGGATPAAGTFTALTANTNLTIAGTTTVSSILDEDNMVSDSATALATQQSIKAYVDSQVTAQDLDFAGDTGTGAVDLDSQVFTVAGTANEIETSASGQTLTVGLPDNVTITTALSVDTINEKTLAAGVTIDSVLLKDDVVNATDIEVATISANDGVQSAVIANTTGVMTIASSVLTTTDINGGTVDGAVIGGASPAAGTFTTLTANTNLTIAGTTTISSILDEDNMVSDSATALATQQSIKAYVDSQVTAQDLDFAGDSGTGAVDLDTQVFTIAGTANEIETSASGQTITVGLPTNVTVAGDLTVQDQLLVTGAGPHSIGTTSANNLQVQQGGSFTSTTGLAASAYRLNTQLTGDTGNTTRLTLWEIGGSAGITTPAAAITVTDVASMLLDEPNISLGAGSAVTNASTLKIKGAPTEATNNYALWVAAGATRFDGNVTIAGDLTVDTDTLFVDATNNRVGIGTASPSYKLHVQGSDSVDASIRAEATDPDSDAFIVTDNDASVWSFGIDGDNSDAWVLSNAFGLGTPKITVTTGGNVGLGTTDPDSYNSTGNNLVIWNASPGITIGSSDGAGTPGTYATIIFADGLTGTDLYTGYMRYFFDLEEFRIYANAAKQLTVSTSGTTLEGWMRTPDGSVSVPSYSFTNDTDTGMYLASTADLRFSVGGTQARIIQTGPTHYNYTAGSGTGWQARHIAGTNNPGVFVENNEAGNYSRFYQSSAPGSGSLYLGVDSVTTLHVTKTEVRNLLGSSGAPSYTFQGDTNTGFYSPAADRFALTAGGSVYLSSELQSTYGYLKITEGAGGTVATLGTTSWSRTWYMGKNLRYNKTGATSSPYDRLNWEYISGDTSSSQMGSLLLSGSNGIASWDFYAVPITTGAGVIPASFTRICRIATNGTTSTGGQIQMTNGASTAPAYSFTNEVDTGMRLSSTGVLRLSADTDDAFLDVDATNNRIYTNRHVRINESTDQLLVLNQANAAGSPYIAWQQNGTRRMYLQYSNNGRSYLVNENSGAFEVQTAADEILTLRVANTTGNPYITLSNQDGAKGYWQSYDDGTTFFGTAIANAKIHIRDFGNSFNLATFDHAGTYYTQLLADQNAVLGIAHTSGTGSPFLAFLQGTTTRRAYIQYQDSTDSLRINTDLAGSYIQFMTQATARMVVLDSGNVGIGTTSPGSLLHLYKASADSVLRIENTGNGNSSGIDFYRQRLSGTGVVGASVFIDSDTSTNDAALYIQAQSAGAQSGVTGALTAANGARIKVGPAGVISFENGASESMRIDSSGRVLLNYSTGNNLALTPTRFGYSTSYPVLMLGPSSGSPTVSIGYDPIGNTSSQFAGDGREVLFRNGVEFTTPNASNTAFNRYHFVLKDGNVGIGTASPGSLLSVQGAVDQLADFYSTDTEAYIRIRDNSDSVYVSSDAGVGSLGGNVGSNANNLNINLVTGNVGIGTTSPGETLEVIGSTNLGGTGNNQTEVTRLGAFSIEDSVVGGTRYGSYGFQLFNANGNYTSGARRIALTNALDGTKFAIIRSVDATTDPAINGASGSLSSGAADFVIDNTGNVGIGTTNPSLNAPGTGLEVVNNTYIQLRVESTTSSAGIEFKPGSGNLYEVQANNSSQWFVYDRTVNQYRLLIDSAGDVGIGTTNPEKRLHVVGDIIGRDNPQPGFAAYTSAGSTHMHQMSPRDAYYSTTSGTRYGVIYIRFPIETKTQVANTMMSMWVDMFDYAGTTDGESWSMNLGGYLSESNAGKWYNVFASTLTRRTDKANHRVRWATDTTTGYFYVLIGETSSTWNYPQIQVRDVAAGYADGDLTHWSSDWEIGFNTSLTSWTIWRDMYSETVATKLASGATAGGNFAVDENPTQIEDAATRTIDWSLGNQQVVDLDSTTTTTININDTTMVPGGSYIILLQKNAGGAQTVNWTSSANLLWVNGQTPVVGTATAGDITVVTFLYTEASTTKVVGAWYQTS